MATLVSLHLDSFDLDTVDGLYLALTINRLSVSVGILTDLNQFNKPN